MAMSMIIRQCTFGCERQLRQLRSLRDWIGEKSSNVHAMRTTVWNSKVQATIRVVSLRVLFGLLAGSRDSGHIAHLFARCLKREHRVDLVPRSDERIMQTLFPHSTMKLEHVTRQWNGRCQRFLKPHCGSSCT